MVDGNFRVQRSPRVARVIAQGHSFFKTFATEIDYKNVMVYKFFQRMPSLWNKARASSLTEQMNPAFTTELAIQVYTPLTMRNSARKAHNGHRAKRSAIQFSFCVMLVFLFHRGLHSANTVTIDMNTREEFMNASRARTQSKALEKAAVINNDPRKQEDDEVLMNATLASPNESFWLVNLDVVSPVQCGANKCFFELKGDPKHGYLLSSQKFRFEHRTTANAVFQTLDASFHFAEYLRGEHKMEHLLLTPPINMTISKALATHLNSNIWSEARQEPFEKPRFKKGKVAFAQKVIKAPEPNLIFGCTASKRGQFSNRVEEFMTHVGKQQGIFCSQLCGKHDGIEKATSGRKLPLYRFSCPYWDSGADLPHRL